MGTKGSWFLCCHVAHESHVGKHVTKLSAMLNLVTLVLSVINFVKIKPHHLHVTYDNIKWHYYYIHCPRES